MFYYHVYNIAPDTNIHAYSKCGVAALGNYV